MTTVTSTRSGPAGVADLLTLPSLMGYPVVDDARVPTADGETAIRFCPARALHWSRP